MKDENISKSSNKKIVLIDVFGHWCEPCKVQDEILEKLKEKFKDKVKFKKIDVDKNKKYVIKYNIKAVPTLIIEKDGITLWKYVGVTNEKQLESDLNKALEM